MSLKCDDGGLKDVAASVAEDDHSSDDVAQRIVFVEQDCESRPKCEKQKPYHDDLAITLSASNVLARQNGRDCLCSDHWDDQNSRFKRTPLAHVLEVNWEIVDVRIVNSAKEEVLNHDGGNSHILEEQY